MKTPFATIQLLAMLLWTAEAHSRVQSTTFPRIKLTPTNEVDPYKGVAFASGTVDVTFIATTRRSKTTRQVCIKASVEGFIPGLLHLHTGTISENGSVIVDFSSMLSNTSPDFNGCLKVTKAVFDSIKLNPDRFYVNAHVASAPVEVKNLAIRGQLLQAFKTTVVPSEEVSPFVGKVGASGVATIKFESAGTVICVDATIQGFDPVLGHLHNAQSGVNGPVVVDFSSTKVAPGRFLGCITVSDPPEAGQPSVQTVLDILDDPSDYYFNFHAGAPQTPDFNVAIRGQLDEI